MRYIKHSLWLNLVLCSIPLLGASSELNNCLEQGKKEFAAQKYTQAKEIFSRCLTFDKNNEEVLLSLGGVCLTQDELDEAKEYFSAALKHMKRTSPYLSYTYSMLGDIALKQKQNKEALEYYNKSLSYNEAYTNSLVGKGVVTEEQGDKKAAAEIYKVALAVEPLNVIARQRLVALEPIYFSDDEILEALKQRYAIKPDQETLTEEDRELFLKIHNTEERGGIEYLKSKYTKVPSAYLSSLFEGTSFSREILTLDGYNMVRKQLGQDAIALFEKTGVPLNNVFELRDLKGNKIFLPDNTLTDSGLVIYNEALKGKRMFLLPSEDVPPTKDEITKVRARIQNLKQKGYTEISHRELDKLKKDTNCNEKTLRDSLGLYVLQVSKNKKYYFVISSESATARKGTAWYYIAKARAKRNPNIKVPSNSFVSSYEAIDYTICSAIDGELLE